MWASPNTRKCTALSLLPAGVQWQTDHGSTRVSYRVAGSEWKEQSRLPRYGCRKLAIQPTFDEICIDVGTAWKNYGRASVNIGGQGDSTMATTETPEEINQDRRRFVETAAAGIAAAGTLSLLPERSAAATGDDAVRPSRLNF